MTRLGIVAAMHEEIASLLADMEGGCQTQRIGQRDYHQGVLYGQSCVVVLARIGKVAAAATAVTLIREFAVDAIVFTGVAGAVSPQVRVGDVVVARQLLQHDLDASPIFPQYQVPLLGLSRFDADSVLAQCLLQSAQEYLANGLQQDVPAAARSQFLRTDPVVHQGLIISGDRFVSSSQEVQGLAQALPDALCVEMEGAAVAQICHEYGVPFAVFRTISDSANDSAGTDFPAFLEHVARFYSAAILRGFLSRFATRLAVTGRGDASAVSEPA